MKAKAKECLPILCHQTDIENGMCLTAERFSTDQSPSFAPCVGDVLGAGPP